MPTQLRQPRVRGPRTHLTCLQKHDLLVGIAKLVRAFIVLRRAASGPPAVVRKRRRVMRMLQLALLGARVLWTLPRSQHAAHVPAKYAENFTDVEFKDHFRFEKQDFVQILGAMGLCSAHDKTQPAWIRVGRRGRHSVVRTDWMLMVLCKRLSSTASYKVGHALVQHVDSHEVAPGILQPIHPCHTLNLTNPHDTPPGPALRARPLQDSSVRCLPSLLEGLTSQVSLATQLHAPVAGLHASLCAGTPGKGRSVPKPCGFGGRSFSALLQTRRIRMQECQRV